MTALQQYSVADLRTALARCWRLLNEARGERDAMRAERDALKEERVLLRGVLRRDVIAERDALRAERDALKAERDLARAEANATLSDLVRLCAAVRDYFAALDAPSTGEADESFALREAEAALRKEAEP